MSRLDAEIHYEGVRGLALNDLREARRMKRIARARLEQLSFIESIAQTFGAEMAEAVHQHVATV